MNFYLFSDKLMMAESPLIWREISIYKIGDNFEKWLRSLEIYFKANSVANDEIKLAKLLHWGGSELQETFEVLPGAKVDKEKDNDVYEIAINKFKEHFNPKKSTLFERYKFYNLSQDDSESIEQFAFRLRRQADKCNFVNAVDEYIRDQITFKTNNDKLRIHILKHDEIKLDEVIAPINTIYTQ